MLDLTDLQYISSSGLRLLLIIRKQAHEKGGAVIIEHVNDEIMNVFRMTGFISMFEIR